MQMPLVTEAEAVAAVAVVVETQEFPIMEVMVVMELGHFQTG